MENTFDLAVAGSGVMGSFFALHAAQAGLKVVVFEKDLMPMEATVRNFGQVVPSGFAIGRWHYYGRYSTQLYKHVQAKTDIGIRPNGSVYIASTPGEMALLEELQSSFAAVDYPSAMLTKQQVLDRWPSIRSDYTLGALFFEQEVSSESRIMIHNLHAYMRQEYGIEFRYGTPVTGCEDLGSKVVVHYVGGRIEAGQMAICNGRDFRLLYPEVFMNANIEVCRLAMMVSRPMPQVNMKGNILTGLTIRRYESFKSLKSYAGLDPAEVNQQAVANGIHVLFKQRDDGSVVIGDSHHYADVAEAEKLGFDVHMDVNRIILEEAKKIANLPDWDMVHYWNGFYAQMKGKEEIFEHSPSANVHIFTAIGGKGMTASAGYAKEQVARIFSLQSA
jgi:FAD dependent oxidoreductase TIGR03364